LLKIILVVLAFTVGLDNAIGSRNQTVAFVVTVGFKTLVVREQF